MRVPGRRNVHIIIEQALNQADLNDLSQPISAANYATADTLFGLLARMSNPIFRALMRRMVEWVMTYEPDTLQRGPNWPGVVLRLQTDDPPAERQSIGPRTVNQRLQ